MKVYLSSYFFGKNAHQLATLVADKRKVGIIQNAGDLYGNEKRSFYFGAEAKKFEQLGFEAEELDLRKYFNEKGKLKRVLSNYGLIWVMGGNSFVLRRALKQSGADELLKELIVNNKIVYAGFSAGAVVATPTLHGIELIDDPNETPENYNPEIVWEGMGFVDFSIAPHYKSQHPESGSIDAVVDYFKAENMPYKALSDGDDIVIDTSAL
jgi:dipeptidase E